LFLRDLFSLNSLAGGLGIIGVGGSIVYGPDWVRDQWAKAVECTKGGHKTHERERTHEKVDEVMARTTLFLFSLVFIFVFRFSFSFFVFKLMQ
jgi:hypothetical protein